MLRRRQLMTMQKSSNVLYEARNLSFNGTAATLIDTGVYLFTTNNINRDFEFIAEGILGPTPVNNGTIICAKYDKNAYGFLVRTTGGSSTQYAGTIAVTTNQKATVIVRRINGAITVTGENITNPGMKFKNVAFDWPLVLGCAVDNNGAYYRYAQGSIDHVVVKWL